jgi:hypothetical protein
VLQLIEAHLAFAEHEQVSVAGVPDVERLRLGVGCGAEEERVGGLRAVTGAR